MQRDRGLEHQPANRLVAHDRIPHDRLQRASGFAVGRALYGQLDRRFLEARADRLGSIKSQFGIQQEGIGSCLSIVVVVPAECHFPKQRLARSRPFVFQLMPALVPRFRQLWIDLLQEGGQQDREHLLKGSQQLFLQLFYKGHSVVRCVMDSLPPVFG